MEKNWIKSLLHQVLQEDRLKVLNNHKKHRIAKIINKNSIEKITFVAEVAHRSKERKCIANLISNAPLLQNNNNNNNNKKRNKKFEKRNFRTKIYNN